MRERRGGRLWTGPPMPERQLADAVAGLDGRTGVGLRAVVLHLGGRTDLLAHQKRVADALLGDAARRFGGDVFRLSAGGLVLIGPVPPARAERELSGLLRRLLPADTVSDWALPDDLPALRAHVGSLRDGVAPKAERSDGRTLLRGTAVVLHGRRASDPIQPLWLEVGPGASSGDGDPWTMRDQRETEAPGFIETLAGALDGGGALDLARGLPGMIRLPIAAARGEAFEHLSSVVAARTGRAPGVALDLVAVAAAPDEAWRLAEQQACRGGDLLVQLDLGNLRLTQPSALPATVFTLAWSPQLSGEAAEVVRDLGVDRVVLTGADSEAAVRWGLTAGLRRFAGRQAETLLAMRRMTGCPAAAGCTLLQCAERGVAVTAAGRAGCRVPALLDAAA